MVGALILNWGLKNAIHRMRPQPFFGVDPETYSFPSGHVLFASCFYGGLLLILRANYRVPTILWILFAFGCFGIGWSRVYLGVHYPTDVVGGYLIGMFWLGALRSVRIFPSASGEYLRGRAPLNPEMCRLAPIAEPETCVFNDLVGSLNPQKGLNVDHVPGRVPRIRAAMVSFSVPVAVAFRTVHSLSTRCFCRSTTPRCAR